jgi:hypothetical protein
MILTKRRLILTPSCGDRRSPVCPTSPRSAARPSNRNGNHSPPSSEKFEPDLRPSFRSKTSLDNGKYVKYLVS